EDIAASDPGDADRSDTAPPARKTSPKASAPKRAPGTPRVARELSAAARESAADETALPAAPPPRPAGGDAARAGAHPMPTGAAFPSAGADTSNDGQAGGAYQTEQVGFGAGTGITVPLNGSGYAPSAHRPTSAVAAVATCSMCGAARGRAR